MNTKTKRPASLAAAPCSVEFTGRQVIERKLLAALDDESKVAILATQQDLEDLIAALDDKRLTGEGELHRRRSLLDVMRQLLREAFPPNCS